MTTDRSTPPKTRSSEATRALLDASSVHAEALARLDFLATSKSALGLLIGQAGCGKSAVLVEFARRSQRQGFVAVQCSLTGVDEASFLADLALELCLQPAVSSAEAWRQIADRIAELQLESLHAVLLLDDLDRAAPSALAIVERLLALYAAPLTIAASARPQTAGRLGARIVENAALQIDLSPWNEAETGDYLVSRQTKVNSRQPAFEEFASRRLFELSGGVPRKVNQLALLAEIASRSQGQATIDEDTVSAVHEELTAAR